MAAKIGILGESVVVTETTTTTLYTVPADKASRVRLLFGVEGAGGDVPTLLLYIGSPGTEITINFKPGTAGNDIFSGPQNVGAGADMPSAGIGAMQGAGVLDLSAAITDQMRAMTLFPHDYYLTAGDTVKFRNNGGTAWDDCLIQVQGVEDDA